MKTANFPGRKNIRRQKALGRLSQKRNREVAAIEEKNLKLKIVEDSVARAIRTKKNRAATGAITR